ncbi:MAG: SH3 domain-containing protein [Burkholderiaceae bacterium]|nr:SH3 domain-containing protein [Burkholderiaceae bacterium]
MKPGRLLLLAASLLAAAAATAQTFEFKSIGDAPAIMYDAPGNRSIKRFIAPPGMPVEVVHAAHGWSKVRDASGDLNWVESKAISAKRTVVVTAVSAKVHAQPSSNASVVFAADKGVLLDIAEPITSSWIKVRHRDGQTGYVRAAEVWGK